MLCPQILHKSLNPKFSTTNTTAQRLSIFNNNLSLIHYSPIGRNNSLASRMGSNDVPPAHVPAHVVPVCNLLLQVGGGLWTLCYVLYVRESFRSKSYGMPLFALALNFAWEVVYALYVAESPLEQSVFTSWLIIDCGMVYGMVKYAKYEWSHTSAVANRIGGIFAIMAIGATIGHWTFADWWIQNNIGRREGKFYKGVVGPDMTELGFWSGILCQAYLSAASLCQLVVRQHSGGVSWAIW